ncbi:MAG: hypothetical protein AAF543_23860 [Pseudomonadota bacterium]
MMKDMTDPTGADGGEMTSHLTNPSGSPADKAHRTPPSAVDEIRLLGQPSLEDHLQFVGRHVVDGASMDRASIADRWRAANDCYRGLEVTEDGIADEIDIQPLPAYLAPLITETEADPRYGYTFDTFPTTIAMVELDRLVVFQTHIIRSFADSQAQHLDQPDNPIALYRFCQPPPSAASSIELQEMGRRRYVFSSPSTDLRQHEPIVLRPEQVSDHRTFGPVGAYIGIPVGFGSNFFTGIRYGDRILLHNGYHRAFAMRSRGVTHAPCIIQTVTRRDELEVAAKRQVADDPAFYFAAARPPLLKDFFDERLAESFKVYATKKMVEVTFDVRDFTVMA